MQFIRFFGCSESVIVLLWFVAECLHLIDAAGIPVHSANELPLFYQAVSSLILQNEVIPFSIKFRVLCVQWSWIFKNICSSVLFHLWGINIVLDLWLETRMLSFQYFVLIWVTAVTFELLLYYSYRQFCKISNNINDRDRFLLVMWNFCELMHIYDYHCEFLV